VNLSFNVKNYIDKISSLLHFSWFLKLIKFYISDIMYVFISCYKAKQINLLAIEFINTNISRKYFNGFCGVMNCSVSIFSRVMFKAQINSGYTSIISQWKDFHFYPVKDYRQIIGRIMYLLWQTDYLCGR